MQPVISSSFDDKTPDMELARHLSVGSHEAFRILMRRHNQMLYRAARSVLKNEAEAEDAVQEAYMRAYKAMETFRGDSKLSTWLVRIVVNEAITRLHKQTRRVEIIRLYSEESEPDLHSSEDSMNESAPEHPDRAAQRSETRRLLESKIDELPDAFRTVFVLRAVEEMSVEEAAAALEIPEATVRTRFFRAKGMLREALSREIDLAHGDAFSFAGARCDRIVANVTARLAGNLP